MFHSLVERFRAWRFRCAKAAVIKRIADDIPEDGRKHVVSELNTTSAKPYEGQLPGIIPIRKPNYSTTITAERTCSDPSCIFSSSKYEVKVENLKPTDPRTRHVLRSLDNV